jgi:cytochrome b involved in lipid metabolism
LIIYLTTKLRSPSASLGNYHVMKTFYCIFLLLAPAQLVNAISMKDDADIQTIRKEDIENHNKDGGLWLVLHGKVYELKDFKNNSPCGSELLSSFSNSIDASGAFENAKHSDVARHLMQRYFVGNYQDPDYSTVKVSSVTSTMIYHNHICLFQYR